MKWSPDVFRPLEKFEATLFELYGAFKTKFDSDDGAAGLFAALSRASNARKSQLGFLHRLAKSIEKQLTDPTFDVSRMNREVEAAERILGMVEHVALESAVSTALQLECGSAKLISHRAVAEAHADLAQMIRGFGARKDAGNVGLLLDFAKQRAIPLAPPVAAAAEAAAAAGRAEIEAAAEETAIARKRHEDDAARRAQEEKEMEEAIKAGKNAIDFRLQRKKPQEPTA